MPVKWEQLFAFTACAFFVISLFGIYVRKMNKGNPILPICFVLSGIFAMMALRIVLEGSMNFAIILWLFLLSVLDVIGFWMCVSVFLKNV